VLLGRERVCFARRVAPDVLSPTNEQRVLGCYKVETKGGTWGVEVSWEIKLPKEGLPSSELFLKVAQNCTSVDDDLSLTHFLLIFETS
jgi:hypothetical protein